MVAQDAGGALKLLVQHAVRLPVHRAPQVVRQLERILRTRNSLPCQCTSKMVLNLACMPPARAPQSPDICCPPYALYRKRRKSLTVQEQQHLSTA